MSDDVEIPDAFFRDLTDADVARILRNDGALDAKQCARVWKLLGRKDRPPERLHLWKTEREAGWAIRTTGPRLMRQRLTTAEIQKAVAVLAAETKRRS